MNLPNHLGIVVTVHAKNEAQKLKRTLLVRRQSFYNNQPKNIHGIWKLRLLKMKRKKKAVSI